MQRIYWEAVVLSLVIGALALALGFEELSVSVFLAPQPETYDGKVIWHAGWDFGSRWRLRNASSLDVDVQSDLLLSALTTSLIYRQDVSEIVTLGGGSSIVWYGQGAMITAAAIGETHFAAAPSLALDARTSVPVVGIYWQDNAWQPASGPILPTVSVGAQVFPHGPWSVSVDAFAQPLPLPATIFPDAIGRLNDEFVVLPSFAFGLSRVSP